MLDEELDETYTALCRAIDAVGSDRTALFLATLGLALLAGQPSAADARQFIDQARRLAGS